MPALQLFGRRWHVAPDGACTGRSCTRGGRRQAEREREARARPARRPPRSRAPPLTRPPTHQKKKTDLPIPAALGLAFHAAWAAYICAFLIDHGLPERCGWADAASAAVLLLLSAFVLAAAAQGWLLSLIHI